MRLLALSGQRGAALAQYEACRHALREKLDVELGEETQRLYERIRSGELERAQGDPGKVSEGETRPPLSERIRSGELGRASVDPGKMSEPEPQPPLSERDRSDEPAWSPVEPATAPSSLLSQPATARQRLAPLIGERRQVSRRLLPGADL